MIARRTLAGRAAFWWAARVKTLCWRHHRLGTALRELRRRLALCREGQPPTYAPLPPLPCNWPASSNRRSGM